MSASAITTRRPTKPLRVIVAEDDLDAGQLLGEIVRELGHSCQVANDGSSAWSMHQATPADVILSDWKMPIMDGLQLCREIRESDPPEGHTHFILITGRNDRRLVEGLQAGADEYIAKPLDRLELEARLEAVWRTVTARRELEASNSALRIDSARDYQVARLDPLTAIANRLRLKEDLAPLEGRVSRYGHRYCAALCDVDAFKAYNDAFGHLLGDDVLCLIVRTIQKHLRTGDSLYRYGGEEFLVILPEQSLLDAKAGMDRVRHEVEKLAIPHAPGGAHTVLTISVGIAELAGEAVRNWLERADAALYRAKALGRNRVEAEEPVLIRGLAAKGANKMRSEQTQEVELLGNHSPIEHRLSSEEGLTHTVFLAEDDDVMRDAVAATLRCRGYLVTEARDGAELLDLLVDAVEDPLRRPCVVVADVRMPNLSGLGVLAALRRGMWDIPVLLITALRDPSVLTVALRLGAIGVLRKPFEAEALLTAVRKAAPGLGKANVGGP